jgi:hypothetical protein
MSWLAEQGRVFHIEVDLSNASEAPSPALYTSNGENEWRDVDLHRAPLLFDRIELVRTMRFCSMTSNGADSRRVVTFYDVD